VVQGLDEAYVEQGEAAVAAASTQVTASGQACRTLANNRVHLAEQGPVFLEIGGKGQGHVHSMSVPAGLRAAPHTTQPFASRG
jgi:hypothetical protein